MTSVARAASHVAVIQLEVWETSLDVTLTLELVNARRMLRARDVEGEFIAQIQISLPLLPPESSLVDLHLEGTYFESQLGY
jgi:hypothetical protein